MKGVGTLQTGEKVGEEARKKRLSGGDEEAWTTQEDEDTRLWEKRDDEEDGEEENDEKGEGKKEEENRSKGDDKNELGGECLLLVLPADDPKGWLTDARDKYEENKGAATTVEEFLLDLFSSTLFLAAKEREEEDEGNSGEVTWLASTKM